LEINFKAILKFDETFAVWLTQNLHYLNDTSAELLESIDNKMYIAVRCSTICLINTAAEMKLFKIIVSGL